MLDRAKESENENHNRIEPIKICFALRPEAEAPGEFETKKGDGRMLVMLERVQEE